MNSIIIKITRLSICVIALMAASSGGLVAQETRPLAGTITLDAPRLDRELILEISVNNHSFVFAPIIGILRPVQRTVTQTVTIPLGETQTDYSLTGIVEDPVDYSVQIRCINCSEIVPRQFYTPSGNKFGLVNSAFIDPDDLPNELGLEVISRASIAGAVRILAPSRRDLRFTIEVIDSTNNESVLGSNNNLVIKAQDTDTEFTINGLSRNSAGYIVNLRCDNCFGKSLKPLTFNRLLAPESNHSSIDFVLEDQGRISLSPLYNLLTEE